MDGDELYTSHILSKCPSGRDMLVWGSKIDQMSNVCAYRLLFRCLLLWILRCSCIDESRFLSYHSKSRLFFRFNSVIFRFVELLTICQRHWCRLSAVSNAITLSNTSAHDHMSSTRSCTIKENSSLWQVSEKRKPPHLSARIILIGYQNAKVSCRSLETTKKFHVTQADILNFDVIKRDWKS